MSRQSSRSRQGVRFEHWSTCESDGEAKALVLALKTTGRRANYESLPDGTIRVWAAHIGSLPEDDRIRAGERWLATRSDVEVERSGASWVMRNYADGCAGGGFFSSRDLAILHACAEASGLFRGLPLTIDEAVSRYLRHIADGPKCVAYLQRKGFDQWLADFRVSHQCQGDDGIRCEWDSRDYTDHEMRMIYDGILAHAGRKVEA